MCINKQYSFDDHPEHRERLAEVRDKWIANALNCESMTEADCEATRNAVKGLYAAAKLDPPQQILFVDSPLVGSVVATTASGAWWIRENPAEARALFGRDISEQELMQAVQIAAAFCMFQGLQALRGDSQRLQTDLGLKSTLRSAHRAAAEFATSEASSVAIGSATHDAIDFASYAATDFASSTVIDFTTRIATSNATSGATAHATRTATDSATHDAIDIATLAATLAANEFATSDITRDAISLATKFATHDATEDTTDRANRDSTRDATNRATSDTTDDTTNRANFAATLAAAHAATDRAAHLAISAATAHLVTSAATSAGTNLAADRATSDTTLDATRDTTNLATREAIEFATRNATYLATNIATRKETNFATNRATDHATSAATLHATHLATNLATRDATSAAADLAAAVAYRSDARFKNSDVVKFLVQCSLHGGKFRDGGNQWSAWCSYLSFFRHVAQLPIDYSGWDHYETAALHSGPRFMHARFCIVANRPEFIHRDEHHRPHCVDGPFTRWRDGIELHYISGVQVTPRITSGQFTAQEVLEEPNAEVRRVMIDKYNRGDSGRWIRDIGAVALHEDLDALGHRRRLFRVELPDDEPYVMIEVTNSTPEPDGSHKIYSFRAHAELRPLPVPGMRDTLGEPQEMTCQNAIASTYGCYGHEYHPDIET